MHMYLHINMTGCKDTKWTGLYGLVHYMSVFKHLEEKNLNQIHTLYSSEDLISYSSWKT